MSNIDNSETFCVNPYLNLSIHPSGVVKACCMIDKEYITDDGYQTLDKSSILKFWNSKDRQKMIQDLNNGNRINECRACWNEEKAGKESKRIRDNKKYQDRVLDSTMLPVVLDLSMGNLCNIKCRICSPVHSTPWMIEESKIINNPKYFKNEKWKSFKDSFLENNSFVWDDIEKLLPNAEHLDFAGGEPFYIDKHWNIIDMCVKNGWSKKQYIHYNTNGTIFPEEHIYIFEEFKFVDIQISSDGIEKKFEYLRHPANWNKVENNIQRFIDAKNNSNTDWLLSICISISAFNVYYMFETFEHYASKGIGIYINLVHDNRGIKILPSKIKQKIIDHLMSFESQHMPLQWKKDRDMVCRHLKSTSFNPDPWKMFLDEIELRDKVRNESFPDTFPDFYKMIKNNGAL